MAKVSRGGWALILCLAFSACSSSPKTLTILHFNDVYEFEPLNGGATGGAARAKTLLDRHGGEKALMLFSGDTLGGSPLGIATRGETSIRILNALGVDAAVVGNHEFDFGPDIAAERFKQSLFPWLSTNLLDAAGHPFAGAKPYLMLDWNGVKVGLIGPVGDWREKTNVGEECRFEDFVPKSREYVRALKAQGAELIVAVTHMFLNEDERLAREIPEIDLILGGHDHDFIEKRVGDTLIWKTGSNFIALGVITVTWEGGRPRLKAREEPVTSSVPDDPAMANLMAELTAPLAEMAKDVVGESEVALDAREAVVRTSEAALGNLVADALRFYTGAEVAVMNGGGIRSGETYPPGPITRKTVQAILPFRNRVMTLKVTGDELWKALEQGLGEMDRRGGAFPHVSGMSYVFDPSKPAGAKLTEIAVGGKPLDRTRSYTLAVLSYLASGGDGYDILKTVPRLSDDDTARLDAEVLADYLRTKGRVAPAVEGRIRRSGE